MVRTRSRFVFTDLPINLRTRYWRERNNIEDLYQDSDGTWVLVFANEVHTWTNTDQGWKRGTELR
jgi:hypothetical protein